MKKVTKILIWAVVSITAILLIFGIFIALFGKAIVESQIEKNLKAKASLKSINIGLPLQINIRGLEIEGLAKIDALSIKPSLLGFLAGKVVLNELTMLKPDITITMDEKGGLNIPLPDQKGKEPPVLAAGINIKDGKFTFIDKKADPKGYKVVLSKIEVSAYKAAFPPTSLFTRFNISAMLGEDAASARGEILSNGWIDFGPKNMEGKVELKAIDLAYLAPYYRKFISDKKLTAGKLNFTSDLKAKDNDLTAVCRTEFVNLSYAKEAPAQGQTSTDVVPDVLDLFSEAGSMVFNFTFRTKLDKPNISQKDLQGMFGQAAVQNLATQDPDKLKEKFKNFEDTFKDIGKQFKEMFKKD